MITAEERDEESLIERSQSRWGFPDYTRANCFGLACGIIAISVVSMIALEAIAIINCSHAMPTGAFTVSIIKTPVVVLSGAPAYFRVASMMRDSNSSYNAINNPLQRRLVSLAEYLPTLSAQTATKVNRVCLGVFFFSVLLQLAATDVSTDNTLSGAAQSCAYISGWILCQCIFFLGTLLGESRVKERRTVILTTYE